MRVGLLQRPLSYIYLCIMEPMVIWGFLLSSCIDVHDSEISAWNASFSAGMLESSSILHDSGVQAMLKDDGILSAEPA